MITLMDEKCLFVLNNFFLLELGDYTNISELNTDTESDDCFIYNTLNHFVVYKSSTQFRLL